MTDQLPHSLVSPETVRAAVARVLEVHDLGGPDHPDVDARLEDLAIDSLLLAEIIVEIENDSGHMLELRWNSPIETLADLSSALRVAAPDR